MCFPGPVVFYRAQSITRHPRSVSRCWNGLAAASTGYSENTNCGVKLNHHEQKEIVMVHEPTWRYLSRDDVCKLRNVGRTRQYEDEKSGRFPPGERHGMRTIRWRSDVVARWLEEESARQQAAAAEILKRQSASGAAGVSRRRENLKSRKNELAGQA